MIKGINVSNPVAYDRDYLMKVADFAISAGFNHIQLNGPIHNPKIGNIDGMTVYRKYAQFNDEKDMEYVNYATSVGNEVTEKLARGGVKTYVWHHELELPLAFDQKYPEILNSDGDVEVTHPRVRDFIENKIYDFFFAYPNVAGIVLTLHETRIPLLKLKNQKLDPSARVKYVTEILYKACLDCGKELIVRPFASLDEDYELMMKAYEEISPDLLVMDKWTQFDWSLTLPHNKFFNKIKNNPLLVETDIFGEFFGKGLLPLMLRDHIMNKVEYCNKYSPVGFCSRVDREGYHPFGTVCEVNLDIMLAALEGRDIDEAIDAFFIKKYPEAPKTVRALMEKTEDIQKKLLYLNGYYYSELSRFPRLNHSKNHFYVEIMRKNPEIASNEWFIPPQYDRISVEHLLSEKREARVLAEEKLALCKTLSGVLPEESYKPLLVLFTNLYFVTRLWEKLTYAFLYYARYFETKDAANEVSLNETLLELEAIDKEAKETLGKDYYLDVLGYYSSAVIGLNHFGKNTEKALEGVPATALEIRESFSEEKKVTEHLDTLGYTDYVVCGGGMEGHKLQKEVNFSFVFLTGFGLMRTAGKPSGKSFSGVNTHGWISYEVKLTPKKQNKISLLLHGDEGRIDCKVTIGNEVYRINDTSDEPREYSFDYDAKDSDAVRVRIDRLTEYTPHVYLITVK